MGTMLHDPDILLAQEWGIKLYPADTLDYEFNTDKTQVTKRAYNILFTLPEKKVIRFQTDDGTEDALTLTQLQKLAEEQHFIVFSENAHCHYIIDRSFDLEEM